MPSLSMMTRYRSGARTRRYSRRPRRLSISISSPRREWWSFVCCLKWSVRPLMRSVSSAICTSGEPVSPSWVRNCSIRLFFLSTASGMRHPSNRRAPGSHRSHARAGSKTPCFVHRYAGNVPRERGEVKLTEGLRALTRCGHVERDLLPQRVDARELPLLPEPAEERQGHALVVQITNEIQEMSLDRQLVLAERRTDAYVHDRLISDGAHADLADVDTDRQPQRALGFDVGCGESQGPSAAGAPHHLSANRVRTAQEPGGRREVTALERSADLRRRDGDAVHRERGDDVRLEA